MGGVGSGRPCGGTNSETSRAAMRAGMVAAHRIKASRPDACQGCGAATGDLDWYGEEDEHGERHRRWLCPSCLAGPMLPLELEMFARTGTSNLGCAQRQEIATEHRRGGDRKKERVG